MLVKFLAQPYSVSDVIIQPYASYTITLPQSNVMKDFLYYDFRGALLVWSGVSSMQDASNVTFQGLFTPVRGKTVLLEFNSLDLTSLGQYATIPDNVFPVFQQGSGFYAMKWSPVSPYTFSQLVITIVNNNPIPIIIEDGIILYDGYQVVTEQELVQEVKSNAVLQ
ncbi:MAG: hypothetical protein QXV17_04645 [Candidatus Micrarchaeaceae archaeon]